MRVPVSNWLNGASSRSARFQHLAALDAQERSFLHQHNHSSLVTCLEGATEVYAYLLQRSPFLAKEYQPLWDFYDALAFSDGADYHYLTFLDRRNYSCCTAPWISQRTESIDDSIKFFREVQAGIRDPETLWCIPFPGIWKVGTTDDQFRERLFKFSYGKRCEIRRDLPCHHFTYKQMLIDEFLEFRQIILQHQSAFILPFNGERDPSQAGFADDHVLKLMGQPDAWL